MTYLLLTLLAIVVLWIAYQVWLQWPVIVAQARAQADSMDDMTITEAARYSFLGRSGSRDNETDA